MSLESTLKKTITGALAGIALACAPISCGPDDPTDTPDGNTADVGNFDSGSPDAGPDAHYDAGIIDSGIPDAGTPDGGNDAGDSDSGPYDAGDDAGPDAGTNLPPVAYAGPDMTIQRDVFYCFNFSNNDVGIVGCGSTPFAPGHSAQGTGSYDPDGEITDYWVYKNKNDLTSSSRAFNGKISMRYASSWYSPGVYTLVLEVTDNKGTKVTDEAVITLE